VNEDTRKLHLPEEQEKRIADWLKTVKFRRRILGGVDEQDVFTKIRELNDIYAEALIAERARYDALLEERLCGSARAPNEDGPDDRKPEEGGSEVSDR